jgi:protein ImuB
VGRASFFFFTREEAEAFCNKHGWEYTVDEPVRRRGAAGTLLRSLWPRWQLLAGCCGAGGAGEHGPHARALACARLALAGRAAERVDLSLRLESGTRLERQLNVPEPTRDATVLLRLLSTHLDTVRSESAVVGLQLTLETTVPAQRQFGLFETTLKDPRQFQETLGRIAAILGSDRVGTPVKLHQHGTDAFRLVPPEFEGVAPLSQPRPALQAPGLRRLRPAPVATVESVDGRPASIHCAIAQGRLVVTLGPWRASGRWWENGTWHREEWDATTLRGQVLRLVRQPDGWTVDALLD